MSIARLSWKMTDGVISLHRRAGWKTTDNVICLHEQKTYQEVVFIPGSRSDSFRSDRQTDGRFHSLGHRRPGPVSWGVHRAIIDVSHSDRQAAKKHEMKQFCFCGWTGLVVSSGLFTRASGGLQSSSYSPSFLASNRSTDS